MPALAVGATLLTLVSTSAPIAAVAQDGPRIAWASPTGVYTRLLPNGEPTRLARGNAATELAVAGDRIAWVSGARVVFASARSGVAVPRATTFTGHIAALVGRGSLLGFTVVANSTDPGTCDVDNVCTGSMTAAGVGYVVRGSAIAALANGLQPRSLLPPSPAQPALQHVQLPADAQVYPTSRGAVVVSGRTLFVVTPRAPRLVEIGTTRGRADGFSVSGSRVVWAETLDAHHARIRALVLPQR